MKTILISLLVILGLSGCAQKTVFGTEHEYVIIKPDPAYYLQCPPYLVIPPTPDSNATHEALLIIYSGYEQCRVALEGIKKSVDDASKKLEKEKPTP